MLHSLSVIDLLSSVPCTVSDLSVDFGAVWFHEIFTNFIDGSVDFGTIWKSKVLGLLQSFLLYLIIFYKQ